MSKKYHKNKIGILFVVIAIFFFMLTLVKIFSQTPENIDTNSESNFESVNYTNQEDAREEVVSKDSDKDLNTNSEYSENTGFDSDLKEQPEMIGNEVFTFSVLDKEYKIPFNQGDSLYDVMNIMKDNDLITFKDKSFSGLGSYIYSINNIEENRREGKYWIYYINGESANVGVSNYTLKNNDEIKWQLKADNY